MLNLLQIFRKNASLFPAKSTLLLLLAFAIVFSEGCSRKIPCPTPSKAEKKAKKTKKKKVVKGPAPADGETATADASETAPEETSAPPAEGEEGAETTEGTTKKANINVKKNRYNKNGLLQGKKYKRLRSNPARKTSRVKHGFFAKLFGGGSGKTKSKKKSKQNVGPVDE